MDRTRQSLKAFVGLNRTLDTLEKIVQRDVKNYG
ncbi:MAG: MarR family transcriptional regulator, partial [Staphylococcus lugdunensis]|nr:MarR family transcriptional regulator [Staphylococcus lugdunensis]